MIDGTPGQWKQHMRTKALKDISVISTTGDHQTLPVDVDIACFVVGYLIKGAHTYPGFIVIAHMVCYFTSLQVELRPKRLRNIARNPARFYQFHPDSVSGVI